MDFCACTLCACPWQLGCLKNRQYVLEHGAFCSTDVARRRLDWFRFAKWPDLVSFCQNHFLPTKAPLALGMNYTWSEGSPDSTWIQYVRH
jgi:hypothetical protein